MTIYQVDIDENKNLADKFNVKSTPTLKCFEADRMTSLSDLSESSSNEYTTITYQGSREADDIIEFIDNLLYGKIKRLENPDFIPPKYSVILASDFVSKFEEKYKLETIISKFRKMKLKKRLDARTLRRSLFRQKLPELFPGLKFFECKDAYMDAVHNISCDFPNRSVRIIRNNPGIFMPGIDSPENYWGGTDESKLVDFLIRRFDLFMVKDFDEKFELVNAKSFIVG